MAILIRDEKYEKALEVIKQLSLEDEKENLIIYYIKKHKEWHDDDAKRLKEYHDFFDRLNSLLPNNNPTF